MKVLYNDFDNLVLVEPSRDGYMRFSIGNQDKNKPDWKNLEHGENPIKTYLENLMDNKTLFEVKQMKITDGNLKVISDNQLSVKIPNMINVNWQDLKSSNSIDKWYKPTEENIFRANYSLSDKKLIGEIEDYKVKVIPGFEINFENYRDLGVPIKSEDLKKI